MVAVGIPNVVEQMDGKLKLMQCLSTISYN